MQPDARKLRLRIPLWIGLSRTVIRCAECFSANCFQMQVLEKIPKVLLLEDSRLIIHIRSRILSLQEVFLVPFLPVSNRIVHSNSKLLRRHWADLKNEWFGMRVLCLKHPHLVSRSFFSSRIPRLKALMLCNTGWPVSLNRSIIWVAAESRFLQVYKEEFHTTSFVSRAEECPVSLRQSFHHLLFLSNQCRWTLTWRWSSL